MVLPCGNIGKVPFIKANNVFLKSIINTSNVKTIEVTKNFEPGDIFLTISRRTCWKYCNIVD